MAWNQNVPTASSHDAPIEAKALRTLSPMFPAPPGMHTFTLPDAPSMVCVTPFGPGSFGPEAGKPSDYAVSMNGSAQGNGSSDDLKVSPIFHSPTVTKSKRRGRPPGRKNRDASDSLSASRMKEEKRKSRKVDPAAVLFLPSLHCDSPRESVETTLMIFDALRRRLVQLDENKDGDQRCDLEAGSIMMANDLRVNSNKRTGHVPGVEIGDMFYFRIEMCLVGLNHQTVAGIDYITKKSGDVDDHLAVSIISAGVYDNADDDPDVLIYTGQGTSANDQKLERGNLALDNSKRRGTAIRVIHGVRDLNAATSKIYIYNGLYKITESWVEKSRTGFGVFKYKLVREPDQPDGIGVWRMTDQWKENPSSRSAVVIPDISNGLENLPVCVVNEVDGDRAPQQFTYATKVHYRGPTNSTKKVQACACASVCLPGDAACSCGFQNDGNLPYGVSGILVSRKSLLYECSDSCQCSSNCRNRVTQKGSQLHFEVFKTRNRGWGLRCLDPIRAGTFVCEYTGEVVADRNLDNSESDYTLHAFPDDNYYKWNRGPELLGERKGSTKASDVAPIIISSKNMGNMSRFMNHSCMPNVFWQPVLYDHGDSAYPHIMFFARKHIPPMTELTFDYGRPENEQRAGGATRRTKICLCGSDICRGTFS